MLLNMGYRVLNQVDEKENFFTAFCEDSLGCAHSRNRKLSQAKDLHLKSWEDFSKLHGETSLLCTVEAHLVRDCLLLKDIHEAEAWFQQLLSIHSQLQRPLPPNIVSLSYQVISDSLQAGRLDEAQAILRKCSEIADSNLGSFYL